MFFLSILLIYNFSASAAPTPSPTKSSELVVCSSKLSCTTCLRYSQCVWCKHVPSNAQNATTMNQTSTTTTTVGTATTTTVGNYSSSRNSSYCTEKTIQCMGIDIFADFDTCDEEETPELSAMGLLWGLVGCGIYYACLCCVPGTIVLCIWAVQRSSGRRRHPPVNVYLNPQQPGAAAAYPPPQGAPVAFAPPQGAPVAFAPPQAAYVQPQQYSPPPYNPQQYQQQPSYPPSHARRSRHSSREIGRSGDLRRSRRDTYGTPSL